MSVSQSCCCHHVWSVHLVKNGKRETFINFIICHPQLRLNQEKEDTVSTFGKQFFLKHMEERSDPIISLPII